MGNSDTAEHLKFVLVYTGHIRLPKLLEISGYSSYIFIVLELKDAMQWRRALNKSGFKFRQWKTTALMKNSLSSG